MRLIGLKILSLSLLCIMTLTACFNNNQNVVSIEVWHHYDGAQKIAFDKLVTEFNATEGVSKGIIVEAFSQGSIDELEMKIINTAYKQVGTGEPPNIFTAHPEVVHDIDKMRIIVNLEDYMKKGEIRNYQDVHIEEGYIGKDKGLKMLPIAASTEIMMINKTAWDKFSNATGANIKELETWEGLARVAVKYYNWTDKSSSMPDDGKAFFARDDMVNYMLAGSYQLGQDILEIENDLASIQIDNDIMRKLWDNYYIPYVNGYYGPFGKFGADDLKTGKIIAYVGSTEGINYFPKKVTTDSGSSHDIELLILPVPNFANTKPTAMLQETGMAVLKSDEVSEKAAVEFLRWFIRLSNNVEFAATTGCLPVTTGVGNFESSIKRLPQESKDQISNQAKMSIPVAVKQMEKYDLYMNKAFNKSAAARDVLAVSLINRAKGDRAKIIELMDEGMGRQEAVATIATETNFEQWVVRFKMELKGVVK